MTGQTATAATASTSAISIRHLNLWFGEKQVLSNINMEIKPKTTTALIGPSGCGKSTLLRTLNRMHDLNDEVRIEGDVEVDGMHIFHHRTHTTQLRKKVGMVFQKPNPFPRSIYDNIAYGLKINGYEKQRIPELVESALRRSYLFEEVKDKLHQPANRLSGGQQQRLCIARTIAISPEIILMDEPCSALDPISTARIEELIKTLERDFTIVIVTHNMQQAQRTSAYTAFMYMGELIEYGLTDQIFHAPAQELTRNYISGNFG
jgi:phosphate transport system ATP-binding protein